MVGGVGASLLGIFLALLWHRRSKPGYEIFELDGVSEAASRFRYKELAVATNNFTNELGKGGFGSVYKGVLASGQAVAVKRLDESVQGEKQFRAEVLKKCTLISTEFKLQFLGLGTAVMGACLRGA